MAKAKVIKLLSWNNPKKGRSSRPTSEEKHYLTAGEIASEYFHSLQRKEKTLRLEYTDADVIDGVWFALLVFFLKLPSRHLPAILSSGLGNLILYFYKAGQVTGSINNQKAASQQIRELNNKIAADTARYREQIGEKYPTELLRIIRNIHESKHVPIAKICRYISDRTEWDAENLRQAYYRRYPRSGNPNQTIMKEEANK